VIAHADRSSTRFVGALRSARAVRVYVRGDAPEAILALALALGDAAMAGGRGAV
jgi:hypothetical protein